MHFSIGLSLNSNLDFVAVAFCCFPLLLPLQSCCTSVAVAFAVSVAAAVAVHAKLPLMLLLKLVL